MLSAALTLAAERALPAVPSGLAVPLSEAAGTLSYALSGRARRNVRANLAVVAPGRRGLARRVFVNQARNYIELFRIPHVERARMVAEIRAVGWEHFERAIARGRGIICASAHLGPISTVGQIIVARGHPMVLPIEPGLGRFQASVNRARRGLGLELVPTTSAIGIHRVLRQGKVLGFLADRAVTGVGERVPFFGREALLPSAHVVLAMRTGAALLPAFAGRDDRGLVAYFEPPLEIPSTGDRDADVREGVRRFAAVLERYVARAPDQWTVFDDVWGAA